VLESDKAFGDVIPPFAQIMSILTLLADLRYGCTELRCRNEVERSRKNIVTSSMSVRTMYSSVFGMEQIVIASEVLVKGTEIHGVAQSPRKFIRANWLLLVRDQDEKQMNLNNAYVVG